MIVFPSSVTLPVPDIHSWSDWREVEDTVVIFTYISPKFKDALSGLRQFLATESLLKRTKNVYYFTLKSLFALRYLNCFYILVMKKNSLIRKIRLISKFLTSQAGKHTIVMHMLPNILRSKGNQTMKLDQLTEYNMRNILLEKLYIKWSGETISRPFPEKSNLIISRDQYSKVLYGLFLLYAKLRLSKYIKTKLQTTCFFHI